MDNSMENKSIRINDERVGKRVVCLIMLPEHTLYGTIQSIERFDNGVEYWQVLDEKGMHHDGPDSSFVLVTDFPELHPGDRVRYRRDEGGFETGMVIKAAWVYTQLRFYIHFDDGLKRTVRPQHLSRCEDC